MVYLDIKISFDSENTINKYFVFELIKIETISYSSSELTLWSIYSTSSTYVRMVCCINKDIFNLNIFQNNLLCIFSNFYSNVNIDINCISLSIFLSKYLSSTKHEMNGNHSRNVLS